VHGEEGHTAGYDNEHETLSEASRVEPIFVMVILGGVLHHVIDGVAIAAGFLISPASGIIVTLAIASHEIPHRIGDFGILLHFGMSRNRTILISVLSSLAATVSAVSLYLLGSDVSAVLSPVLGIAAGFFIYIAATDIIPTIHQEQDRIMVLKKSLWLIAGVTIVSISILLLEGFFTGVGL
jgi:zinc and cadmium transporter